jgi:hypothetical protein
VDLHVPRGVDARAYLVPRTSSTRSWRERSTRLHAVVATVVSRIADELGVSEDPVAPRSSAAVARPVQRLRERADGYVAAPPVVPSRFDGAF